MNIEHNNHKSTYQTVEELLKDDTENFYEFSSKEDRQKCIDTNELWSIQIYPDTPIGFYVFAGSTFEKVLEDMNKELGEKNE